MKQLSMNQARRVCDGVTNIHILLPRWANWGEQGVTMRVERHQLTLDGPIGTLWLVHHSFTKDHRGLT